MPIGKNIYNKLSKRHGERHKRLLEHAKRVAIGEDSPTPPEVNGINNIPVAAKPKNVDSHIPPRKVSPMEGVPAVNSQSGPEVVEKAVHPPRDKYPRLKASEAAINPAHVAKSKKATQGSNKAKKRERRCSLCRETGHTKKTCKMRRK